MKMVLETAQILSTAHHVLDGDQNQHYQKASDQGMYRPSHVNHPTVRWAHLHVDNYRWTYELFKYLCFEFEFRRQGKKHKTSQLIGALQRPPDNIASANDSVGKSQKTITPPLVMPEEFQLPDPVESYRNYYFSKWQEGIVNYKWGRDMPEWLRDRISLKSDAKFS